MATCLTHADARSFSFAKAHRSGHEWSPLQIRGSQYSCPAMSHGHLLVSLHPKTAGDWAIAGCGTRIAVRIAARIISERLATLAAYCDTFNWEIFVTNDTTQMRNKKKCQKSFQNISTSINLFTTHVLRMCYAGDLTLPFFGKRPDPSVKTRCPERGWSSCAAIWAPAAAHSCSNQSIVDGSRMDQGWMDPLLVWSILQWSKSTTSMKLVDQWIWKNGSVLQWSKKR